MGWRLSLRTPARLMLVLSASSLTYFSKVALSQCDSHAAAMRFPWTVACLHTVGLGLCALPAMFRYILAAMRAGRAVISSSDLERSDPLDPTRHANALDYARVAAFGALRCIVCVLLMAGLQYLQLSHFLCMKTLLFSFVSVASFFRRKNFFRYHSVGAVLGILGASLVGASVALNIVRADHAPPCYSPADPSPPLLGPVPLAFGMACVALSQALLAMLYCLEDTFLSRVKFETQFFMGLQGVFGSVFMLLCCVVVRITPAYLSSSAGELAPLLKLCHEDVAQALSEMLQFLPLSVSSAVIVAASCLSVVACIITTQHASASCRLILELTQTLALWAMGIYFSAHAVQLKNWTFPVESWQPQCVVVALGLLIAAIGQAVYHRAFDLSCFVYPSKWTLMELRDLHVLPQVCGFEQPWHLGHAAERWRVAHYQRQERASNADSSKRRTVRFKPGPALYEFFVENAREWEGGGGDDAVDGAVQAAEVKRIRAGYYSRIGVNRGSSPTFDVRGGDDAIEGSGELTQPLLLPQRGCDEP